MKGNHRAPNSYQQLLILINDQLNCWKKVKMYRETAESALGSVSSLASENGRLRAELLSAPRVKWCVAHHRSATLSNDLICFSWDDDSPCKTTEAVVVLESRAVKAQAGNH